MRFVEELCEAIRCAFRDVRLGNGIGLNEGNALDDYASSEKRAAARSRDEAAEWQRITVADLNRCHSALSYFDAEGMRFHLPAFMIADVRGDFAFELVSCLTTSQLLEDQMRLLSAEQREAIRQYLEYCRSDANRQADAGAIDDALEGYWRR